MSTSRFYKKLTQAEVGQTKTHEVYIRMPNDFDYEKFFNNTHIENGSVIEVKFTASTISKKNLNLQDQEYEYRFVFFANSNKEKRIPGLGPLFKAFDVEEGDVVCLERIGDGDACKFSVTFYNAEQIQVSPAAVMITAEPEDWDLPQNETPLKDFPLQVIYFGAPGTGKSHKIKGKVKKGNHVRTTFHPDSDYASFVGAYKPTMTDGDSRVYSKSELVVKLSQLKSSGTTYPCQKFGANYWESLKDMTPTDIKEIINTCGFTEPYYQEVNKGIAVGQDYKDRGVTAKKISYKFVAQAFLQAYVEAWKNYNDNPEAPERFHLVIEEINRGNCAQIFGDLFQLLDRDDNGESSYAIWPDRDIQSYLAVQFAGLDALPEKIRNGSEMKLPSNLYILATMNTSDQSLFPIDSAFKRRWDWEYIPITNQEQGWFITIDNHKYDWWSFLDKINARIYKATESDDKQMGYRFINLPKGKKEIDVDRFVGKALFYLWNDVFKDFGDASDNIFAELKLENGEPARFKDFFGPKRNRLIQDLMAQNEVEEVTEDVAEIYDEEDTSADDSFLTDIKEWRLQFWTKLHNIYTEKGFDFTGKLNDRAYYQMPSGVSYLNFINSVNKQKGTCWVGLYMEVERAEKLYKQLAKIQSEINLPFELEWIPNTAEHRYASIRAIADGYNFDKPSDSEAALNWLADCGTQIFEAFKPYLAKLK